MNTVAPFEINVQILKEVTDVFVNQDLCKMAMIALVSLYFFACITTSSIRDVFIFYLVLKDINECKQEDSCGLNQRCRNLPGSFYCICDTGFQMVGDKCKGMKISRTVKT